MILNENKKIQKKWLKNVKKSTKKLDKLPFNCYPYPHVTKQIKNPSIKYKKELFPLFNNIFIETTSWCNYNCSFCPSVTLNRPHHNIKDKLFKKIIDELKKIDYKGSIQLYQSNEPLTDSSLEEHIKYVVNNIPKAKIGIVSNLLLLNESRLKSLYEAGLTFLVGEVYTSEKHFNRFENMFMKFRDKIGHDNIILEIQNKKDKKCSFFKDKFKRTKKIFTITLWRKYNWGKSSQITSRAGFIKTSKDVKQSVCVRPFRQMQVCYNGKVILCCEEWMFNEKSVVGDLNKNTIVEIWNGKPIMEIRNKLQKGNRNFHPCDVCDYSGGSYKWLIRRVKI